MSGVSSFPHILLFLESIAASRQWDQHIKCIVAEEMVCNCFFPSLQGYRLWVVGNHGKSEALNITLLARLVRPFEFMPT